MENQTKWMLSLKFPLRYKNRIIITFDDCDYVKKGSLLDCNHWKENGL